MDSSKKNGSLKKRAPGCLGDLLGMKFPTQLYRDYNKPL